MSRHAVSGKEIHVKGAPRDLRNAWIAVEECPVTTEVIARPLAGPTWTRPTGSAG